MIRYGLLTALSGSVLLFLPLPASAAGTAFVLIGLGLSPVFPSMLHETPVRFGKENSQAVIGYQMGFGYIGSALFPMLFGLVFSIPGCCCFRFL